MNDRTRFWIVLGMMIIFLGIIAVLLIPTANASHKGNITYGVGTHTNSDMHGAGFENITMDTDDIPDLPIFVYLKWAQWRPEITVKINHPVHEDRQRKFQVVHPNHGNYFGLGVGIRTGSESFWLQGKSGLGEFHLQDKSEPLFDISFSVNVRYDSLIARIGYQRFMLAEAFLSDPIGEDNHISQNIWFVNLGFGF